MEKKENSRSILTLADNSRTLFLIKPTGEIRFMGDGKEILIIEPSGKVTLNGIDGESEATPAIYWALRKALRIPEDYARLVDEEGNAGPCEV